MPKASGGSPATGARAARRLTHFLALITLSVAAGMLAVRAIGWLERDRCLDAGGRWDPAAELCTLPPGAGHVPPIGAARTRLVAALVTAALTVALWGGYLRLRRRLTAGRTGVRAEGSRERS